MRVLVVGGGGREHALCWSIAASPMLETLFCAPGNPGIARIATLAPIAVTDVPALVRFAREQSIDLVVPGPEVALAAGLADAMGMAGIACCGPSAAASRLETSKSFGKEVCDAAGVPTAAWERFDDPRAARLFVRRRGTPVVVKADGLAAGKGVFVAATPESAEQAITDFMDRGTLGQAGSSVVIEEMLVGEEVSVFALCDGAAAIPFGMARDHKRVGDGDTGPNTGGMGACSPPLPGFGSGQAVMDQVIRPTLAELARRGTPFRGILFAGLMLTADGPKLIEFNVRLGDPEAQCLLPRLQSDILPALQAACDGALDTFALQWRDQSAVAVVLATQGYPGASGPAGPIEGIDAASALPGTLVFHSGTAERDGMLCATGGRALTVVGTAPTVAEARARAYAGIGAIRFPGAFCRRDIALPGSAAPAAPA